MYIIYIYINIYIYIYIYTDSSEGPKIRFKNCVKLFIGFFFGVYINGFFNDRPS